MYFNFQQYARAYPDIGVLEYFNKWYFKAQVYQ